MSVQKREKRIKKSKYTERFELRFSEDELADFYKAADKASVSASEYARNAINEAVARDLEN